MTWETVLHGLNTTTLKTYIWERKINGAENDEIAEKLLMAMQSQGMNYIHSSGATAEQLYHLILNTKHMIANGEDIDLKKL